VLLGDFHYLSRFSGDVGSLIEGRRLWPRGNPAFFEDKGWTN
jgi:hypothetical protein